MRGSFIFEGFRMQSFTYYNGTFDLTKNIRIPITDRSIYFGDGVYDAAIGKNGKIFLSNEHIERILSNTKRIGIGNAPSYSELNQLLNDVVRRAGINEFFVYFQITRNAPHRIHSATEVNSCNLLITVSEITVEREASPISLITAEDIRYFMCDIKTLNLLPSVLASTKAEDFGADEAVFHRGNTVTECAHSNISILKNGTLFTHPANNLILPGITRKHLLCACDKLGIPYKERAFTLDELFSADEILVTSTSKLCRTVYSIDNIPTGQNDTLTACRIRDFLYKEYESF